MIKNSVFPDLLKQVDIKLVYKKDFSNEKEYFRAVDILPNLSKINECCIYKQRKM